MTSEAAWQTYKKILDRTQLAKNLIYTWRTRNQGFISVRVVGWVITSWDGGILFYEGSVNKVTGVLAGDQCGI